MLGRQFAEISSAEIRKIRKSLDTLNQEDAELYQSSYQEVFEDESVGPIVFDEFKKLFQVKSISEIFDFASQRAIILRGEEDIESSTVSFFKAYFEKDNSCQLWIINLGS